MSSAAVKFCTAAHMSLRSPLRLPIAETASAFALASSRNFGKLAHIPDCGGGPPISGPPCGGPPCIVPDGKTDCCGAAGNVDCRGGAGNGDVESAGNCDCCGGGGNGEDCCGAGGNGDCASAACESIAPAAKASPIATTKLRFIAIPCGSPNPKTPKPVTGYAAPVSPAPPEA